MKNVSEIQFTIDQLRKDKIIYAVEATAINMACVLAMFASSLIPWDKMPYVAPAIPTIGILYTIYMGVGNFMRWRKIIALEKKLKIKV